MAGIVLKQYITHAFFQTHNVDAMLNGRANKKEVKYVVVNRFEKIDGLRRSDS